MCVGSSINIPCPGVVRDRTGRLTLGSTRLAGEANKMTKLCAVEFSRRNVHLPVFFSLTLGLNSQLKPTTHFFYE